MLTERQAAQLSDGALRSRCERLANNDDETQELLRRGFDLKWSADLHKPKLSLYVNGLPTHGPDAHRS